MRSPSNVAAILDDEDRPQHAEYLFIGSSLVLYMPPETVVPPLIRVAAETVVLPLA